MAAGTTPQFAVAESAMTVISLPLIRPAPDEMTHPSTEAGNQPAYNIIVHPALQRTESKLYRNGRLARSH